MIFDHPAALARLHALAFERLQVFLEFLHLGAPDGVHRDLDRLSPLTLREAARRKKKLVERDTAAAILDAEGPNAA